MRPGAPPPSRIGVAVLRDVPGLGASDTTIQYGPVKNDRLPTILM